MISKTLSKALLDAEAESEYDSASSNWISGRIKQIHDNVSAFDVLRANGIAIQQTQDDRPEQISCPFHGKDSKPSARIHPAGADSPSALWCFVCNERWDAIALWKKFSGNSEMKFTRILFEIERAFGLQVTNLPQREKASLDEVKEARNREEVVRLLALCERRLVASKAAFEMKPYLILGQILDRLSYQIEHSLIEFGTAKSTLTQVLDKIGEKERMN